MDYLRPNQSCHDVIHFYHAVFGETSEAAVYTSSATDPIPLSSYLQQRQQNSQNPGIGDIILIPRDPILYGKLEVELSEFNVLAALWTIPPAAARYLLRQGGNRDPGYYEQSLQNATYTWFGLPICYSVDDKRSSSSIRTLVCSSPNSITRTIMVVPRPRLHVIEELLQVYQRDFTFDLDPRLETLRFHVLLLEKSFESLSSSQYEWAVETGSLYVIMDEVLLSTSNTQWFSHCDRSLIEAEDRTRDLKILKKLYRNRLNSTPRISGDEEIREAVGLLQEEIENYESSFREDIRNLKVRRDNMLAVMDMRNAQYVLRNTIAYRRLAEQSDRGNRNVAALAEASRNDARAMKKVAYLTMLYLPGTFIATVFSMPFFDIDADARFTAAINKLWIYGTIASALTALTFIISWVWDRLQWLHTESSPAAKLLEDEAASPLHADDPVLEPVAAPEPDLHAAIKKYWSEVNKMQDNKMETMASNTSFFRRASSLISESSSGSSGPIDDDISEASATSVVDSTAPGK